MAEQSNRKPIANQEGPSSGGPEGRGAVLDARLRYHQMMLGKKLKDVAKIAGCSESLLSKLENERANPSVQMLHQFALQPIFNSSGMEGFSNHQ